MKINQSLNNNDLPPQVIEVIETIAHHAGNIDESRGDGKNTAAITAIALMLEAMRENCPHVNIITLEDGRTMCEFCGAF
jgi:hypothetical protein